MKMHLVRRLAHSTVLVGLITVGASFSQAEGGGQTLFKTKCAACHGVDGKGEVPAGKKLGARDLSSTEVQSQSDAQLTDFINKGKNKMPAYGTKLNKDQTNDLVAYIRELGKKK